MRALANWTLVRYPIRHISLAILNRVSCNSQSPIFLRSTMTKPIPDKAEVAIEYPDKLYIGTFERSSRFDAHLDQTGISFTLERKGDISTQKSVHIHLHYGLFAEMLHELARTADGIPAD